MKSKPKYSGHGDSSRQFWGRVKKVKDDAKRDAVYLMGCMLQDLEGRVLRYLDDAERPAASEKEPGDPMGEGESRDE